MATETRPLLEHLIDSLRDVRVESVYVGAFVTAVKSNHCGLSSTLRDPCGSEGAPLVRDAGDLCGMEARVLAAYALSDNQLEASIGMAAINSALPLPAAGITSRNASDLIRERGRNRRVAVIGHFPFVPDLEPLTARLMIFEKRLRKGDLPSQKIPDLLPEADVVALSGTTLINHTFEEIRRYIRKDAYVLMLGPSTPLSPLLFEYGIDALSGTVVKDEVALIAGLSQGATFRQLRGKSLVVLARS
jgi:uncharacterized protein (DUF4213/DUF364 family)